MTHRPIHPAAIAAAKSGFSTATAYRLEKDPWLPSAQHVARGPRRSDPIAVVWDSEIVPMLKAAPGLRAAAIFEGVARLHPDSVPACAGPWSAAFGPSAPCSGPSRR